MKTRTEKEKHEMLDTVEREPLFIQHGIHLLDHKYLYRKDKSYLPGEKATLLANKLYNKIALFCILFKNEINQKIRIDYLKINSLSFLRLIET